MRMAVKIGRCMTCQQQLFQDLEEFEFVKYLSHLFAANQQHWTQKMTQRKLNLIGFWIWPYKKP